VVRVKLRETRGESSGSIERDRRAMDARRGVGRGVCRVSVHGKERVGLVGEGEVVVVAEGVMARAFVCEISRYREGGREDSAVVCFIGLLNECLIDCFKMDSKHLIVT